MQSTRGSVVVAIAVAQPHALHALLGKHARAPQQPPRTCAVAASLFVSLCSIFTTAATLSSCWPQMLSAVKLSRPIVRITAAFSADATQTRYLHAVMVRGGTAPTRHDETRRDTTRRDETQYDKTRRSNGAGGKSAKVAKGCTRLRAIRHFRGSLADTPLGRVEGGTAHASAPSCGIVCWCWRANCTKARPAGAVHRYTIAPLHKEGKQ